jgi:exodeoxyribonuclease III
VDVSEGSLKILTLNVCSPSRKRAERQLEWLGERPEQVFVLTEVSGGAGSELLGERLRDAGWSVHATPPGERERGVMVGSRVVLSPDPHAPTAFLPERVQVVSIADVELIGVYAPSRDESPEKTARKRRFLAELLTAMGERRPTRSLLIGDLNVVERSHRRADRGFQDWEYELYEELPAIGWLDAYRTLHADRVELSWVDAEGHGYRFDHTFITADLRARLARCEYIHETRERELSDHSAMVIELNDVGAEQLEVDRSLTADPPSLF